MIYEISFFSVVLENWPLEDACKFIKENEVSMIEIGCGGYPEKAHCDAAELLMDDLKLESFKDTISKYHLQISALSAHGNMLHPDPNIAREFDEELLR